jgi:hypothetical protein
MRDRGRQNGDEVGKTKILSVQNKTYVPKSFMNEEECSLSEFAFVMELENSYVICSAGPNIHNIMYTSKIIMLVTFLTSVVITRLSATGFRYQ